MRATLASLGWLFIGSAVFATGCGNFVAGGDIDIGVQAFRDYMPEFSQVVAMGESVKVDNLAITVTGVRATDGRDNKVRLQVAPEGYLYILVNVQLENQGDQTEEISTRMNFGLFNSSGQPQEWAFYPAAAGSIDGRIDPGRQRMGELTWKVAENADGLMLMFGDVAFFIGEASGYRSGPPG